MAGDRPLPDFDSFDAPVAASPEKPATDNDRGLFGFTEEQIKVTGSRPGFAAVPYRLIEDAGISCQGKAVYMALGMSANYDHGGCWPSYNTIAMRAGVTRATVSKALTALEASGYIEVTRQPGFASIYHLTDQWGRSGGGVVQMEHYPSSNGALGVVQTEHTNDIHPKEIQRKKSDIVAHDDWSASAEADGSPIVAAAAPPDTEQLQLQQPDIPFPAPQGRHQCPRCGRTIGKYELGYVVHEACGWRPPAEPGERVTLRAYLEDPERTTEGRRARA